MVAQPCDAPRDPRAQGDPVGYIMYTLLPLAREASGESAQARWLRRVLLAEADRLWAEWNIDRASQKETR